MGKIRKFLNSPITDYLSIEMSLYWLGFLMGLGSGILIGVYIARTS